MYQAGILDLNNAIAYATAQRCKVEDQNVRNETRRFEGEKRFRVEIEKVNRIR